MQYFESTNSPLYIMFKKASSGEYGAQYGLDGYVYGVDPQQSYNTDVQGKYITVIDYTNAMGFQWEAKIWRRTMEDILNDLQTSLDILSVIPLPVAFFTAQGTNIIVDVARGKDVSAVIRVGRISLGLVLGKVVGKVMGNLGNKVSPSLSALENQALVEAATANENAKIAGITNEIQITKIGTNAADAIRKRSIFTKPTILPGGKPKGNYEVPSGDLATIRSINRQNQSADLFAIQG